MQYVEECDAPEVVVVADLDILKQRGRAKINITTETIPGGHCECCDLMTGGRFDGAGGGDSAYGDVVGDARGSRGLLLGGSFRCRVTSIGLDQTIAPCRGED